MFLFVSVARKNVLQLESFIIVDILRRRSRRGRWQQGIGISRCPHRSICLPDFLAVSHVRRYSLPKTDNPFFQKKRSIACSGAASVLRWRFPTVQATIPAACE